jgi:Peptidase inhibitor family I36
MFRKSKVFRRVMATGALTAGLVALGTMAATPASAAVWQCNVNGTACLWTGGGYSGTYHNAFGNWASLTNVNGANWNDIASSIANKRTSYLTWYSEAGYWGLAWGQVPGAVADLTGGVYNDALSSFRS